MIALPPSLAGAVNDTRSDAFRLVAVPMVGAPGTVIGISGPAAADGAPVPSADVAATVQLYVFPLVTPLTVIGLALADAEALAPPLVDEHAAV